MHDFDIVILGAGAAGLMCAAEAGKQGRRVAVLDHQAKAGQKILISGGGRCNFTNLRSGPEHFVSENPDFCRSALSRYTPADFVDLVKRHGIPFHEKKDGQLFCDGSARDIVKMLLKECKAPPVSLFFGCTVESVGKDGGFSVCTDQGTFRAPSLVVATGGLSFPKVGATDLGYRIACQFGLKVIPPRPALDGFVWAPADQACFGKLAGVSLEAVVRVGDRAFQDGLLFTHSGVSGPAALQASLYWEPGAEIRIDFSPGTPAVDRLLDQKRRTPRSGPISALSRVVPRRLAEALVGWRGLRDQPFQPMTDAHLRELASDVNDLGLRPVGTVGYAKAEVTRGGVDTKELSSKNMEALRVPGLYFIGEVVDVTGELGGHNFQWAWSSAMAAGR